MFIPSRKKEGFADINGNLLTPWSRVLIEKLTGLQLVKKFPASPEGSLPHLQVPVTCL
jgi:hypothetical protein